MADTRIEKDSMGEVAVPAEALYGAQTQRAIDNFPISGKRMPWIFVHSLVRIKSAAAAANEQLECLPQTTTQAIIAACKALLDDDQILLHFPVDVFQTGSGTSTNMNANEVIANLASKLLGDTVSPNDHVNFGQSSNDVIPTTIHVGAALRLKHKLIPSLEHAQVIVEKKAESLKGICKTGRTHLMDAMPVRFDQVLSGWAAQIKQNIQNLKALQPALQQLAIGGTAVGTGINTHPQFAETFCQKLSSDTGIQFTPAGSPFALISSQDTAVALSGQLKACAVTMMKIANDLRWMNSGPLAGLGEIQLEALQPGSSIMPGKVNPVIPEAVAMVAAQIMGYDASITIAGQSGNFELNVMLPLIAKNLLDGMDFLSNSIALLADKAIKGFTVNEAQLNNALDRNPILVTALNPIIGYLEAAKIAKQAYQEQRPVIDVAEENTNLSREELEKLLDPKKLTQGGLQK